MDDSLVDGCGSRSNVSRSFQGSSSVSRSAGPLEISTSLQSFRLALTVVPLGVQIPNENDI